MYLGCTEQDQSEFQPVEIDIKDHHYSSRHRAHLVSILSHLENKMIGLRVISSDRRIAYKHSRKGRKDEICAKMSKLQQRAPCFINVENDLKVCI